MYPPYRNGDPKEVRLTPEEYEILYHTRRDLIKRARPIPPVLGQDNDFGSIGVTPMYYGVDLRRYIRKSAPSLF